MSMDKSAVMQIQESANIPELLKQLGAIDPENPIISLPESMRIHDLQHYLPNARHYCMSYGTGSIEDFLKYAKKFTATGTTCFVDADSMAANLIVDLGTPESPGHKHHQSHLGLEKTAAFDALLKNQGMDLSQRDAGDFIEDWADCIIGHDREGDSMSAQVVAGALKDLTIDAAKASTSKVHDFGAEMSEMAKIEARSSEKIPAFLSFKCIPYNGLKEREFKVRVGILTGGPVPVISLRIQLLEQQQEDMAEEFKGLLVEGLDKSVDTYIGKTK